MPLPFKILANICSVYTVWPKEVSQSLIEIFCSGRKLRRVLCTRHLPYQRVAQCDQNNEERCDDEGTFMECLIGTPDLLAQLRGKDKVEFHGSWCRLQYIHDYQGPYGVVLQSACVAEVSSRLTSRAVQLLS